ncbi:hypothetical protein NDA13_001007 [Ustilago tritici]|nr:hypothetical protein NDA13_001007 [Ustilago tritici]
MSDWASSLGYSASDVFSDSDDEGLLQVEPLTKSLALKPVDEESVPFTDTPFSIAARNAQVRKARQSAFRSVEHASKSSSSDSGQQPVERASQQTQQHPQQTGQPIGQASTSRTSHQQHQQHQQHQHTSSPRANTTRASPYRTAPPLGYASTSSTSLQHHELRPSPPASSSHIVPPRQGIPSPPPRQARTPSIPSEAIVISDDSEDEVEVTGEFFRGGASSDVAPRSEEDEEVEVKGEEILQQLFEEDRDFYESLEQEMAAKQQARSDSASSLQIQSMIPDAGSTSYDTSSFAPTYATSTYPPHAEVSPPAAPGYAPVAFDAYGRPMQYAPVSRAATPARMMPVPAYPQTPQTPVVPYQQPYLQHHQQPYQQIYQQPYQQPYQQSYQPPYPLPYTQQAQQPSRPYTQQAHQPYQYATPSPQYTQASQSPTRNAPDLSSFRRPRTPRQAQADKAKADMIMKALQGSKRSRAKPRMESYGKENEWSTLKASRTGPDGTLSLTAALRRPLPATRLPQSGRGGTRIAMPLYRPVGSTAEARRRAETLMLAGPSRPRAAESSTATSSSSTCTSSRRLGTTAGPSRASKLFRPSPLSDKGKGVARN